MTESHGTHLAQQRLQKIANHIVPACPSTGGQICRQCCAQADGEGILHGKVAIVTGAGKGIGEATAKLLAKHGVAIAVCDLDGAAARQVCEAIKKAGGRAIAMEADVTHAEAPQKIVEETVRSFGRLDILVNNAGFTWDGTIHKMGDAQWDIMLAVHCTAPFRLIKAATVPMREAAKKEMEERESGVADARCIINISSVAGTHGGAGQTNYSTAKAGVIGLTKAVAKEWGPFNIRCNAISYGLIDTRLTRSKEKGESIKVSGQNVALGIPQSDAMWEVMAGMMPLRRKGTVDDAAGAILLMASPWANYITGQVLEVDGGMFM